MNEFARKIISWQLRCGRHGLPWQDTRDPYRIWLSEIMLQQTTSAACVPYYRRFIAHFPTVEALAQASEEEVLSLWSGLGYYSRARNLRRAAQIVTARHGGRLPDSADALRALPGIGEYTAGAIRAASTPMMPLAPGLFSTMTFCLRSSVITLASKRPVTSVTPPVDHGTIRRTGRFGQGLAAMTAREPARKGETVDAIPASSR